MALTVTPGGASDDALITLANFQTYCASMGHVLTDYTDTQQEQAIRGGTSWVEGVGAISDRLPTRWPGVKTSATQRRTWPRSGATEVDGTAIASDIIPAAVQDAVAEAAFYALGNPGVLHTQITPAEAVKQEKVGPLSVTYHDPKGASDLRAMLTVVDDLLSAILIPDLKGPGLYFQSVGRNT